MKNRSRLLLILALCLTVLFAVSLAACNPNGTNKPGSDNPNSYEIAKYTVTFNTNSSFVLENPVVRDIPYGDRVKEPANSNGEKIKPLKTGYTFLYWSKDGSTAFDFSQGITGNTTLTAIYRNNTYKHTPMLRDKLLRNNDGTYSIEKNARGEDEVALTGPELDKLVSTYASSSDKFPCPKKEGTKFCFWYYMNSEGQPIQLSKWAADGEAEVSALATYYFTSDDKDNPNKGLTIYPMFADNLPSVTVTFKDSGVTGDNSAELPASTSVTFGQKLEAKAEYTPSKVGYSFDYWYYVVETKSNSGEVTKENRTFLFEDGNEKNPTSPMDAAGAENNFANTELVLYAKWTKEITIKSVSEFNKFYDDFKKLTKIAEPSSEQLAEIEEILTANIIFEKNTTFDFGNKDYEPLFDSAHPFKGTIDGAVSDKKPETEGTDQPETTADTAITKAKFKGGVFGDGTFASVFGYNQGTIKNIDFEEIGFNIDSTANVYIGVVAHDNAGTIENCNVMLVDNFGGLNAHKIVFGGITANNHGVTSRNGVIRNCDVTIENARFTSELLTFGGIAGVSDASASLVLCNVQITISDALCEDDNNPSNGRSMMVLGGLVGENASHMRLCKVNKFEVTKATSLTGFVFGGVVGVNTGNINLTYAKGVSLNAEVCGSLSYATSIGGMVGVNEGYALNCWVDSKLNVAINSAPAQSTSIYIGGIMGSNYSNKEDPQPSTESGICSINYCYSLGSIDVKVKDGVDNVSVYAGGIAGRNTHKKLKSIFTTVNINVTNDGENNLGFTFGKMVKESATNGNIYLGNGNAITLNKGGKAISILGKDANSTDSEFKQQCSFTNIGSATEESNFKSSDWVVGAETTESKLGFNGESYWKVDADSYPSFLEKVYADSVNSNK